MDTDRILILAFVQLEFLTYTALSDLIEVVLHVQERAEMTILSLKASTDNAVVDHEMKKRNRSNGK